MWTSKTFWFNALTAASALLVLPEFTSLLGANALRWIVLANAVINIILRRFTSAPATFAMKGTGDGR